MGEMKREDRMDREQERTGMRENMEEWGIDEQVVNEATRDGIKVDKMYEDEKTTKKGRNKKRHRLTGSLAAKIIAFFLLAGSAVVGAVALIGCIYLGDYGFYGKGVEEVLQRRLRESESSAIFEVVGYIERGDIKGAAAFCEDRNVDVELIQEDWKGDETVLWGTWDGYDTPYIWDMNIMFDLYRGEVQLGDYKLQENEEYVVRAYVDPAFTQDDNLRSMMELIMKVYDVRYALVGIAAAGILLCVLLFVFLMCCAGHQNGQDGIVPSVLAPIPLDVLTFLFGMIAAVAGYLVIDMVWYSGDVAQLILFTIGGALLAVWGTLYCMELAVRLKRGKCFRYTLVYMTLRGGLRICRFLGRGLLAMLRGIPLVLIVVVAYLGLCILEFLGVILFIDDGAGVLLWAMEKVALFPIIMYIALVCTKLLLAGRALAQGQGDCKVDTSRMLGEFKEHGENLNSIGQGISKAVAERLRSERLKTELITNVSHDLKTPLTSIINYADLICEESMKGKRPETGLRAVEEIPRIGTNETEADSRRNEEGAPEASGTEEIGKEEIHADVEYGHEAGSSSVDMSKITEYAQVLLRQSRRLKKLLENLLEASKATTGNLEVNLEPCEVGVLLSQAVGEYQQRMEEKQLDLITRQPEEIGRIMADGRHLWRVFDNLLNNICKYAQERSRVYLSVEERVGCVQIIFRNMSKYPLDISAEELEERFVRGDKSRHMEGNGLGLSIAKSLVELQNGRMEITIDGDLFKVTLSFAVI